MTTGSCLCGAVRFEVSGPYKWMTHCHCSMCRKHHGSLYGTTLGVDKQNFRWLQGESDVVHYRSSAAFERPFCRRCGSVAPDTSGETVIVPAGALADDLAMKPRAHIFVKSKSPLHDISDTLRQFDEYPEGFGQAVPAPAREQAKEGVVTGSCLCGEAGFEIDETPTKVVNCHCSRCRQSRGAAYATNVFASADKLRWTRGAEQVRTYRVPEAKLYATSFCAQCGGRLPSLFERIGRYNIPVGSLDTVLRAKPALHIYVGSKAPWFDITDPLPQFDAMPPRERIAELMF
jgi:hypothetical protein